MPEPIDIDEVRKLCRDWLQGEADESDCASDKLHSIVPQMADEIEALRHLLKRCEPVLDSAKHESHMDEDCQLLRDVRRAIKETSDA